MENLGPHHGRKYGGEGIRPLPLREGMACANIPHTFQGKSFLNQSVIILKILTIVVKISLYKMLSKYFIYKLRTAYKCVYTDMYMYLNAKCACACARAHVCVSVCLCVCCACARVCNSTRNLRLMVITPPPPSLAPVTGLRHWCTSC